MTARLHLTGRTFGRLTVIRLHRADRYTHWLCACSCGNTCVVLGKRLTNGETRSCGCLLRERVLTVADSFYNCDANRHEIALSVARMVVEECAKIVESQSRTSANSDAMTFYTATGQCAAAIRKLGEGV